MKKTLITFLVSILLYPTLSFWECRIQNSAPEELKNHVKDIRKIVSNVTSNVNTWEKSNNLKKTWKELLRWLNSMTSWQWFETEFEFSLVKPITSEIPYPIKRDDFFLKREIDNLNNYLENIAKRWYYDVYIEKSEVCYWIRNCELEWKAWDIIISLVDNTRKIRQLLQLSAVWHPWDFNDELIIVDTGFINMIKTNYSEFQVKECSESSEDWFFKQIKDAIWEISLNNELAENGTKKWTDAWDLLIWNKIEESEEKRILEEELSRQWVWWDQNDAIMQNLDDYNNAWWFSKENNFTTNSFNKIQNSINTQWDQFSESVSSIFWKEKDSNIQKTSISNFVRTSEEIDRANNIKIIIEELYKSQIPLAQMQDLDTTKITTQVIKMHNNLWISINVLEKTIPISQKVCRDQAFWKWQCEY